MSEFADAHSAVIIKENNQGYLVIKNCISLFNSEIGFGGQNHSFNITIKDNSGQISFADESVLPENIFVSPPDKGYKIKLSTENYNTISGLVNQYNGKFKTIVKEYTTSDNKVIGNPVEFSTSIEGDFSLILDERPSDSQFVDSPELNAKENSFTQNNSTNSATESMFKGVNDSRSVSSASNKKSLILPIIAGVIALILLLLAILWWLGVFSSNDISQTQNTPVASEQNINDPESEQNSQTPANEPKQSQEETLVNNNQENGSANNSNEQTQTSEPVAQNTQNQSVTVRACELSSETDAVIINNCLASKPEIEDINLLAKSSFEKDRCDLGKRLFSSYGRKDAKVAYSFALYFDPTDTSASKCVDKDRTQALYWYQKAKDLGMNEAQDAIAKLKE